MKHDMVAIGLIYCQLTADHDEDDVAKDPRIDALREKMVIVEDEPMLYKFNLESGGRSAICEHDRIRKTPYYRCNSLRVWGYSMPLLSTFPKYRFYVLG